MISQLSRLYENVEFLATFRDPKSLPKVLHGKEAGLHVPKTNHPNQTSQCFVRLTEPTT